MKRITIRCKAGRIVRDPNSKAALPLEWVTKDDSSYWQKKVQQGDVELKPAKDEAKIAAPIELPAQEKYTDDISISKKIGEKKNGDV
jgi:hypothetical protein